jgi:hypothetical protein
MNVTNLSAHAAMMRGWPAQQEPNGDVRIEVPLGNGRTQLVQVTMARDGDGDPAAFVWSRAGDHNAARDPVALLRLNAELTYGRVAIKGNDVVVLHALHDATAEVTQVGKTIYWVARAADDIEKNTYGAFSDTL